MPKPLESSTVNAPGFYGLNTQDSSVGLEDGYATIANNAVVDKFGRIASRKGWVAEHAVNAGLSGADIRTLFEHIDPDGTITYIAAANNKLWKMDRSANTLTEITYNGGGVAPVITADNWQCASLNGRCYLFQQGYDPLVIQPSVSTTNYRRISEDASYVATVPSGGNIVLSAYGRLWAVNANAHTLYWSDTLMGYDWTTSSTNNIDMTSVFTNGSDDIVAIEAINGFLVLLCRKSIIIYGGAKDPGDLALSEVIKNVGCVARDSVQNTGNDILFLSDTGVQSLARLQQNDTALPMRDVSRNVRDDILQYVVASSAIDVKSCYNALEAVYVISFSGNSLSYCFDMRGSMENGAARATTWSLAPTAFCTTRENELLLGVGDLVGKYTGYQDNGATYRLEYYTNYRDLQLATILKILKRIAVTAIGSSAQEIIIKWGFDYSASFTSITTALTSSGAVALYGVAEYDESGPDEYTSGTALSRINTPASGSGLVLQLGFEAVIQGAQVSFQNLSIYIKQGKSI